MLTVSEAVRRARRNPETIRRWIRSGRLAASKVGTQHVIAPLLSVDEGLRRGAARRVTTIAPTDP